MELINSVVQFAESVGTTPDDALYGFVCCVAAFMVFQALLYGLVVYGVFRFFSWISKRCKKKP